MVPAYRVVAHFVKQARKLPEDEGLHSLETQLRRYVRSSLSPLYGSYAEIGERWAVTQLGDPNLDSLATALKAAELSSPRGVVEEALRRSTGLLPRPDLSARFLLLPGDG